VSDAGTFNRLVEQCFAVWLKASPGRVIAQGDNRPMAGNAEAMGDLRRILAGRSPSYAKADLTFDTSGQSLEQGLAGLREAIDFALTDEAIAGVDTQKNMHYSSSQRTCTKLQNILRCFEKFATIPRMLLPGHGSLAPRWNGKRRYSFGGSCGLEV